MSRNEKEITSTYPELAEALQASQVPPCVVDGEVVAFDGDVTSFQKLQGRMQIRDPDQARRSGIQVYLYLFDILHFGGSNVRALPLRRRKELLRRAIDFEDPLRFTPHRNQEGEEYYQEACASGWEGVIAKRAASSYQGTRSRDWLKFKCVGQQEFIVGGFTEPRGSRNGFGSLLIGYRRNGDLVYAGKVGTGYDEATLARLRSRLDDLMTPQSPFDAGDPPAGAHWVAPEVVIEVGFTEWTEGGRLRHPRYLGVRRDKAADQVVRETPS
jgi:DNA ligase D-like protein (predicted ligase)